MNDPQDSKKENPAGEPENQEIRYSANENDHIRDQAAGSYLDGEPGLESVEQEPVVAELVGSDNRVDARSSGQGYLKPAYAGVPHSGNRPAVDLVNECQNMSAIGGAVGAIVLGIWSIVCSMITPFSSINAIMALLLGFYGMHSKRRRLAILGMVLGLVGLALSLMETNEILSRYFAEEAAA